MQQTGRVAPREAKFAFLGLRSKYPTLSHEFTRSRAYMPWFFHTPRISILFFAHSLPLIPTPKQMPVMDGITATREIRSGSGPNKGTPIVALTGKVSEEDRTASSEAGMNGMLAKPCTLVRVRETLTEFVPVLA